MHGLDKIILDFGASHVSVSIFPWEWDSDICIHVGTVDSFDQIADRCAINMMNTELNQLTIDLNLTIFIYFFLSNIESMNMCTLSLDCLEINAIGTP